MEPTVYHDLFEDGWTSVQSEFKTDAPEPFKVLFASYSYEDYNGDADVLWQNADGTFGYVSGGQCSCCGLEDQFDPETYTAETLLGQVERARSGFFKTHEAAIRQWVQDSKLPTELAPPPRPDILGDLAVRIAWRPEANPETVIALDLNFEQEDAIIAQSKLCPGVIEIALTSGFGKSRTLQLSPAEFLLILAYGDRFFQELPR